MGGITLYLNDFVEERDRRRRRRLRLRAAGLMILLLLGIAAAWPPDRPPAKPVYVNVPVEIKVPVIVEVPVRVPVPVPVEVPVPVRPDPPQPLPARSTITPASLEFAAQTVGSASLPKIIGVASEGDEPLRIGQVSVDSDAFQVISDCGTLARSARCVAVVVFAPVSSGPQTAILTIGTNAGTTTVPLSGVGTAVQIASPQQDVLAHSDVAGESYLPLPRHLCVSPREVNFPRTSAVKRQRVTVSNPGSGVVRITGIRTVTMNPARGFAVDATECADRTLLPNERCIIDITVLGAAYRAGGSMQIVVTDDAGEETGLLASARK